MRVDDDAYEISRGYVGRGGDVGTIGRPSSLRSSPASHPEIDGEQPPSTAFVHFQL